MKQSEQAKREDLRDSKRNEAKLVEGVAADGHWPDGQHAPIKDQGFDRTRQGAPRADDRSGYRGQSAYGSLEAGGDSAVSTRGAADSDDEHRGGLSKYGNNLGSQYSVDQEPATSQRTADANFSQAGSAPGAAPAISDVGQYAGEYDDAPNKTDFAPSRRAESVAPADADNASKAAIGTVEIRGDERLREEIHQRLSEHPDLDIHNISVALRSGHATLEGSVPDAHMKQVIVQVVDNVSGVLKIDDRITVQHVNPANHGTAQAYAVGGQVTDDPQHSGPATFGAASAKASAMKQQEQPKQQAGAKQTPKDGKS